MFLTIQKLCFSDLGQILGKIAQGPRGPEIAQLSGKILSGAEREQRVAHWIYQNSMLMS